MTDKIKDALRFYADEKNWHMVADADCRGMHNAVDVDRGAIAREALGWDETADVDITSGHVSMRTLVKIAKDLASEDGENPEYDRALVELLTYAAGYSMDQREAVAKAVGIKRGPT